MQATLISDEQLAELVESTFTAMLALPVSRDAAASEQRDRARIAASIHITGTFNGTVLFSCTERFGRRAASILLGVDPAEVTLSDGHDTVAELTNILGGGIKSILPGPSTLSLPSITHGSHFNVHVPGTVSVGQIQLDCEADDLQLHVLQAVPR